MEENAPTTVAEAFDQAEAQFASEDATATEPELDNGSPGEIDSETETPSTDDSSPTPTGETHRVKVNGEEIEVGYDELLNGYQRQADYTRKTQELAAYKQLKEALEADPVAVAKAMQEAYLLGDDTEVDADDIDPVMSEIEQLKAWKQQQEEAATLAKTQAEAESALRKHELADVTADQLFEFGMANGIMNLDSAARFLKAEQTREQSDARKAQKTEDKKRSSVIEGGATRNSGVLTEPEYDSFGEQVVALMGLR